MAATYHIVSHTHWDREWYLGFEEFRVRLVHMVDHLIRHMEENPSFVSFLFDGQTAMVLDYLALRPERTGLFREWVKAGRFQIGPWYILSDEFLPDGESHVRNLLIGFATARTLGEPMRIGYLPDQFGHISQMPQILRGFGIDTALIYRGFGGEPGEESSEYEWRSPDGSSVLMIHLPRDGYSFGYFARDGEEEIADRFRRLRGELDRRAQTPHRLVMNGGDHFSVDTGLSRAIGLLDGKDGASVIHSSLPLYAEILKAALLAQPLPRVEGELRFGLRHAFAVINGTASSRMPVKLSNYRIETLLEKWLEPLNAIAVASGHAGRNLFLRRAWMKLLQNQDHDVICGASVDRVYEDAAARFRHAEQIGMETIAQIAGDLLPRGEEAHGDDRRLFLFNLLPRARRALVECEVEFHLQDVVIGINPDARATRKKRGPRSFRLLDAEGGEVPFQILGSRERYGITYSNHAYPVQTRVKAFRVLVDAKDLPAMGYARIDVVWSGKPPVFLPAARGGADFIENEFLRVETSADGSLAIRDLRSGEAFGGLHLFEEGGDIGDGYTYCPPDEDRIVTSTGTTAAIALLERGPLRAALRILRTMRVPAAASLDRRSRLRKAGKMDIETIVSLAAGSRRVEFRTRVNNGAKDHRLRLLFATGIGTRISLAGAPFDLVRREHAPIAWEDFPYEKPLNLHVLQRSVEVRSEDRGLLLLTKGIPEYELKSDGSGLLALTLLRCVGELSASNLATRPGGDAGWKNETPGGQCPGTHLFEYALVPWFGEAGDVLRREEEEYHSPVLPISRKEPSGAAGRSSLIEAESGRSRFSACKEAEEGGDILVRFFNPTEASDALSVRPGFRVRSAALATLGEEPSMYLLPDADNAYRCDVPPHGIVTLRFAPGGGA